MLISLKKSMHPNKAAPGRTTLRTLTGAQCTRCLSADASGLLLSPPLPIKPTDAAAGLST